jgi:hypothetical protein
MLEAAVLRVFRACLAFVLRPEDDMSCGVFVRVTSVSFECDGCRHPINLVGERVI